jgi:hypothetical protein
MNAWREGVSKNENCLSPEALQELMEGVSSSQAAGHLAGCPHCQSELAMLKNFASPQPGKNNQADVNWIVNRLQSTGVLPSPAARIPYWRPWLTIPRLSGAAAAMLTVALGLSLYLSNRQERPSLRTESSGSQQMRSGDIRLVEPSGDLERVPQEFRWEALPVAKSYSIQLLEVDGTVLWSGQSVENFLAVSPELQTMMRPGKALLWKVTAIDASGTPVAGSSRERFRVTARP